MTLDAHGMVTFHPSEGGCRRCGHLYMTRHRDGPCTAPGCECPEFDDGLGGPMFWALVVLGTGMVVLVLLLIVGAG